MTREKWISRATAVACGADPREEFVTMGWLFHLCDRMPETRRSVVINAALWGVHSEEADPMHGRPFDHFPVAPRVAAQLRIPEAS